MAVYGYESKVSNFFGGAANQTSIFGHDRSLLTALEGHSLGGLVLKDELHRSWDPNAPTHLKTVYQATQAVVFMGTPHRGSDYADWGLIVRRLGTMAGFDASDRIIRDLKTDSSTLDKLNEDFSPIHKTFNIYTYQEGKGLKGVRGLTDKVKSFFAIVCSYRITCTNRLFPMHRQPYIQIMNNETTSMQTT